MNFYVTVTTMKFPSTLKPTHCCLGSDVVWNKIISALFS